MSNDFDFSFNMQGIDRQALLTEAAERVTQLRGHFGPGVSADAATKSGESVRDFINEEATLSVFPDIYRITDQDYLARDMVAPVKFDELTRNHRYYWLRIPVGLAPKRGWSFNMIEVRIEFKSGDGKAHLTPKAYQILPSKKFQTMLQAHQKLELSLDENFEFAAKTGEVVAPQGKVNVGVASVANAGAGVVLGPFTYELKRAQIDHNALGMEWVFWRLDGAQFFQDDSPELIVIAQVPMEAASVQLSAQLQAYRNFNFLTADLTQVIQQLPSSLRNFFTGGMPLRDEKQWDLTPRL
jgi:hypothetical protein